MTAPAHYDPLASGAGWTARRVKSDTYLVSVDSGSEVIAALNDFLAAHGISSGRVSGIGAVSRAVLRFFDFETKGYVDQPFDEQMELSNLTGNVARKGGQTVLHAHATLGRADYTALAGHLSAATIHGAGEFYVVFSDVPVFKTHRDDLDLDIYDLSLTSA